MCLKTKQVKPCIAKDAIPCVKVVIRNDDGTYSPIFAYGVTYTVGKNTTYKTSPEYVAHANQGSSACEMMYEDGDVTYGLHSFKPNVNAIKQLYKWCYEEGNFSMSKVAVIECEIPKDTLYFEGQGYVFSDLFMDQSGYTSEYLYVKRELTQEEIDNLPSYDRHTDI
jgi:hypothetical protein